MSLRPNHPVNRPVLISVSLFAVAFAVAIVFAATAHAAYYRTMYCAAADGSGNPVLGARPGFFNFPDLCGTAYGDPAGNGGFLRLEENTTGTAGDGDEASYSWYAPPNTSIAAVSAYTREPGYFNQGWRARLWAEGFDGSENNILMQGYGVPNEGLFAGSTGDFAYHAWPFGGFGDYKRLVFGLACVRPAGCSREGWNAADANSILITLQDKSDPHVNFEGESPILNGDWVRGDNAIAWRESDEGSGLRFSRLKVDGSTLSDGTIDYQANGGCRTGHSDANGEFAADFTPCPRGPYLRYYGLYTEGLSDGQHQLQICLQDYSQYQHIGGSASETCDTRTIRTDNTPPGKPAALAIRSANPNRYLDHFGATFSLPPDPGSPIAHVHYLILNAKNEVVVPEQVIGGTNPTEVADIQGPRAPGAYRLKLWLEDSVGFQGEAAEVAIPHDTTPPAAPQELQVGGSGTRWLSKADVHWTNVVDAGSPIDAAHYQLLGPEGEVLDGTHTVSGDNVEKIEGLQTPEQRGHYKLRVWLQDEEGNVGAASTVPLPIDTTPPAAPQDLHVVGQTTRWASQLDLAWKDLTDDGSPIDAAHYRFLDASGNPVGDTQTVSGEDPQAIGGLQTPSQRGQYKVQIWLEDAEGNVGAAASTPLPIDTTPPAAPQGLTVTPPSMSRSSDGFDVSWQDITDSGSPITAAHYQVLDASGKVVVATQTVRGKEISALSNLEAPSQRGDYRLKLWLEDEEGNAGAATTAPLAYECVRSDAGGGSTLTVGLGEQGKGEEVLQQGTGTSLRGRITTAGGGAVAGASICVFSRVVTDQSREFLGLAISGEDGAYRFAVPAGASRELNVLYRSGHRELNSRASVETVVHPEFKIRKKVVRNKHFARFVGRIPGPDNEDVVIVLQVRRGKGWLAFRRYRTRGDGWFNVGYRFNRTDTPTKYVMRAEVRAQGGYPYVQGNSRRLKVIVLPQGRGFSRHDRLHRRSRRR